jgi:hypothetical protein
LGQSRQTGLAAELDALAHDLGCDRSRHVE